MNPPFVRLYLFFPKNHSRSHPAFTYRYLGYARPFITHLYLAYTFYFITQPAIHEVNSINSLSESLRQMHDSREHPQCNSGRVHPG
jgi:hypothetical protein